MANYSISARISSGPIAFKSSFNAVAPYWKVVVLSRAGFMDIDDLRLDRDS